MEDLEEHFDLIVTALNFLGNSPRNKRPSITDLESKITVAIIAVHAARLELAKGRMKITDVRGPTGAVIARVGTFDHKDGPVQFRITISDDESNADRYYRGFNDGYDLAERRARGEEAE
jgi:hypothetical protein